MPVPKVRVLPSPEAVAGEAAQMFVDLADRRIAESGQFTVALAGGRTPESLYRMLAEEPYASAVDWLSVEFYFGDERCVPPTHEQSNYRMASQSLLERLEIPRARVHRMRGEIEPQEAAIEYGRMLKQRFGDGGLDLALLGMGEDGHTASLFPGSEALDEREHRCVAAYVPKLSAWRLTLTAPFINRSGQVLVLVTGSKKAARVQEVLEGERDPHRLPMQLIDPPEGRLTWLLDAAAAGMT